MKVTFRWNSLFVKPESFTISCKYEYESGNAFNPAVVGSCGGAFSILCMDALFGLCAACVSVLDGYSDALLFQSPRCNRH